MKNAMTLLPLQKKGQLRSYLWKAHKETSFTMESGNPGEIRPRVTGCSLHSQQKAGRILLTRKNTLHIRTASPPFKKKKIPPCPQRHTNCCLQPIRNCHQLELLLLSNELLFETTLLKPKKGWPSLCLWRLAFGLPYFACAKWPFLCHSQFPN